jgi:hypothetical protein
MPLTLPEQDRALDIARAMARVGIPIFVARPALNRQGVWQPKGGTGNCGYKLPDGWQATVPDPRTVDTWQPGMALCAVGGTVADFLDNDPRNGGDASAAALSAAGHWPLSYGRQATPSGGVHDIIAPLRVGSRDGFAQGLDLKGGTPPDAAGKTHRGFIFLAPTVKISKVNGTPRTYRWLAEPDLLRLIAAGPSDRSGAHIAVLARKSNSTPSQPGPGTDPFFANSHGDVREFTRQQAQQFCAPYLDALYNAQIGYIYDSLNKAALVLGHFGPEFWPYETTMQWLWTALGNTAYNGATWQADKTIDKALSDGAKTWQATLVEPRPFVERVTARDDRPKGAPRRLPLIPGHVWERRSWLRAIRDRAQQTANCPDAVLGATLGVYAASVPHTVKIDTGFKDPLGTSLLVGLVSPSGRGKSSGWKLARNDFAPVDHAKILPIPTGEGIIEALIGQVEKADPFTGVVGKVREQKEYNAIYYIDEGEALNAGMKREGASINAVMRSLFSDTELGNSNASEERRRYIAPGNYSLAVVVGYQPSTAMQVIRDTSTGMAQRFLWFSAMRESTQPSGVLSVPRLVTPNITSLDQGTMADMSGRHYLVKADPAITRLIWEEDERKNATMDMMTDDPDSQKSAVLGKLAGLACLIEGRGMITLDDWQLATELYEASCAIRDELIEIAEEQEAAERREKAVRASEIEQIKHTYPQEVRDVAASIMRKAAKEARPLAFRDLNHAVTSKKRAYVRTAIEFAIHEKWLCEVDGKYIVNGTPNG